MDDRSERRTLKYLKLLRYFIRTVSPTYIIKLGIERNKGFGSKFRYVKFILNDYICRSSVYTSLLPWTRSSSNYGSSIEKEPYKLVMYARVFACARCLIFNVELSSISVKYKVELSGNRVCKDLFPHQSCIVVVVTSNTAFRFYIVFQVQSYRD